MAAITPTGPFQCAAQSGSRRGALRPQRRALTCKAQTEEQGWQRSFGAQLLAAGLATLALTAIPQPSEAKVVLEQPKTKKVFQGRSKAAQAPQQSSQGGGGPSLPSISLPSISLPSVSLPSVSLPGLPSAPSLPGPDLSGLNSAPGGALDPRSIALPGAIVGIGAAGFAAFSLDSGFREMMREGLVKDSSGFAGYEEAVDEYAAGASSAARKGTKKISKAVSKGKEKAKGKGGGIGGLFGKK